MLSVRGTFENGIARPNEPVARPDGEEVIITFLASETVEQRSGMGAAWDGLLDLVEGCGMDTGISDLAQQHDHYLHGHPKRE